MGEDTLGEGLSGGGSSKGGGESEGFSDGEMGSDDVRGGSLDLFFFDNDSSSLIENVIDSSHTVSGSGDFGLEDGFLERGAGGEFTSVVDSSGGGDQLTTSSVDGIGVEDDVHDVDFDGSHVFVGHDGFFGGPLESIFHGVFDFVHELNSLGGVTKNVGSLIFGSEGPDFEGFTLFPTVFIDKTSGSFFGVGFGSTGSFFDFFGESFGEGFGLAIESVMFVGGFGETDLVGFFSDGFFIGDDGVGFDDFNVGEFGFQIMETDFDVEFSATSDDVFSSFFSGNDDEGVGFGKFLESIDQFGEILSIFGLDGDSDDGGDGVFHGSDAVSVFVGGEGSGFEEILIDSDESDSVTTRDIGDVFYGSTHHEDGSLDGFNVEVFFFTGLIVGSHDSDLFSGFDGSREDSSEGEESGFIGGGDHLGDVHHEGSVGVTLGHGFVGFVFLGSFVEIFGSVGLGGSGGGKVEHHHLNNDIGGVQPSGHDDLEEVFSDEVLFILFNGDSDGFEHLFGLIGISFHDSSGHLDDGGHDELTETSFQLLVSGVFVLGPFLFSSVVIIVSPEFFHHLGNFDLEFSRVNLGESGQGEGPLIFSGSEGDVTLLGVKHEVSHGFNFIVGNDNVDHINHSDEVLIHRFRIGLELKDRSINLVNHQHGSNSFGHGLSKHSFGLHANSFDGVDNDQSSISNSESGSDFG